MNVVTKLRAGSYHLASRGLHQMGFSLIEVLVTILILCFGLLGVAGLLVGGVSNAADSESLAKANQLAADMADRIRANPVVALSATSEYLLSYSDTVPSSPTTIAAKDKKEWMQALAAQLPQGKGRIYNTVGGGQRKVNIEVRWSKCMGTINDADQTACRDDSTTAFRTINFELQL
ncbi:type IV pilus modification protein PilV [Rhodoferax saidenbachensis]|uniref:Type IV pilus assembly protein PilV n=1 Tax=Rhodoferax saidenbachensis TaxID=1484693 RepID=A0ABU1ZS93_9BURK|nr:type IV pilus modification protein PilV [Rhodoferax saidenbachensis]MDR7308424.1 type IV pilus assembly protein PilV [Rhodoferax saidenbachensis]